MNATQRQQQSCTRHYYSSIMIITLCIKCRCATSLVTEPKVNVKTITRDPTKFVAIICAACDDSDVTKYNDTISPDQISSMQEWKYVTDYVTNENRVFNINTVGDYIVIFNHWEVVSRTARVVKSQPIVTCKHHTFHVHPPPKRMPAPRSNRLDNVDTSDSDYR